MKTKIYLVVAILSVLSFGALFFKNYTGKWKIERTYRNLRNKSREDDKREALLNKDVQDKRKLYSKGKINRRKLLDAITKLSKFQSEREYYNVPGVKSTKRKNIFLTAYEYIKELLSILTALASLVLFVREIKRNKKIRST